MRFELTTSWTRTTRASRATLRPVTNYLDLACNFCRLQRRNFASIRSRHPSQRLPSALNHVSVALVIGTLINAGAILVGGIIGLTVTKDLSAARQVLLKNILGIFTVWVGLSMSWKSLNGGFGHILKQLLIVILALTVGRIVGQLLRIQKSLNRIGQLAKEKFAQAGPSSHRIADGFVTCTLLFCVGPMAILGALQDGLYRDAHTLIIKACMDGLATIAFAKAFGWGVMLSAIPVLAYQGSITLLAQVLEPVLRTQALLDSLGATGGLLIFCVALVVLGLKKIDLADYLPSLVMAPLLTWWWG